MHPAIRSFRFTTTTLALALTLIALPALAATPVANVDLGYNSVSWTPQDEFAGLLLTVSGPEGTWQNDFGPNEAPQLDLSALGATVDGLYTWELRATPYVGQEKATGMSRTAGSVDAGLQPRSKDLPPLDSLVQNGAFRVLNGTIVQPGAETAGPSLAVDLPGAGSGAATAPLERATAADQVINDDLIVDGSACVGMDCANGLNFGFDTIIVKENNTRLLFDDTSNSASFPANDWRLTANDSSNGGENYLAIEDATAGRVPFRVEAGAPANSLVVEASGDIGINTKEPVVELHIIDGDTPTIRLQQDGSSGFGQQTWDIAGNETNFFVRDVTNGSKLPFKIFPNAPTNALTVEGTTGDIGLGTQSPTASLHIARSNASVLVAGTDGTTNAAIQETSGTIMTRTLLSLSNNGGPAFSMTNTNSAQTWRLDTGGGDFNFTLVGTGELAELDSSGNLMITGQITTSGSCNMGCDRVFLPDYELPSIEDHADEMFTNSYLPAVGPTPDEGTSFNLSQKTTGMLNELEKAHIYIAQLNDRLKDKEATVDELSARLAALEAAVQNN